MPDSASSSQTPPSQRVALFGGTFDPVHLGHIEIARRARDIVGLDRVVFLPCARSPFKMDPGQAPSPDSLRLDMLRAALRDIPWAEASDLDLRLPPPSYSWRVAEEMARLNPDARLYWLMGLDQWRDLELWNRWQHLASLVTFIVNYRPPAPGDPAPTLIPRPGVHSIFLPGNHPASASEIRQRLKSGAPLPPWLHPDVERLARLNPSA